MSDILVFSTPVPEYSSMPMINAGMGAISGWLKEEDYDFDQKSLIAECRHWNQYRLRKDPFDLSVFKREDVIRYLRGEENEDISREANKLADYLNIDDYDTILVSAKSNMSLRMGIAILKERCQDKLVVVGGSLTLNNDLEIARLPFIDYGVVGDGEVPLNNILEHELEGKELENDLGLVYTDEEGNLVRGKPYKHPMDMKAKPYFEQEVLEKMASTTCTKEMLVPYQLGRGCTQDCSFCNYFENQKYQYKSVDKVVRELKEIKKETGAENIYFTDSNLFNDPDYVEKLAEELIKSDLDINWGALAIIIPRDQEFFDKLAESGCVNLLHGIESASNSVLHRIRKAQTRSMIEETLEKEHKAGIKPFAFFICDYVNETMDEYMETINFFRENENVVGVAVSLLAVYKSEKAPLYSDPERFDIEIQDPEYEDFIDRTFTKRSRYIEKNRDEKKVDRNFKAKYMQRTADWELHFKNYGRQHPVTFLKRQFRKLYTKSYLDYLWLYK